jgi:hypothetical protein
VNTERGIGGRVKKRDREQRINGERDRTLESFGNGVHCKIDSWD